MHKQKKITTIIILLMAVDGLLILFVMTRAVLSKPGNYHVIPAYEGQAKYIAAVKADPLTDKDTLYQKYVTGVYQESCGGGGLISTSGSSEFVAGYPLGNFDDFAEEVRLLQDSNAYQAATKSLQQSWKILPGSKVTACIFALDPIQKFTALNAMHGIYGSTYGPGLFLIEIVPMEGWLDWLPYTVAHEYHHTVYFQDYRQSSSSHYDLLEVIISEGRADSFAQILYPTQEPLWAKALTPEQEATQWQLMQTELDSTTDLQRYMFGDDAIPWWAGYTIGYHIVQKYLQSHPKVSIEEWTRMDALEILKQSGYTGQP